MTDEEAMVIACTGRLKIRDMKMQDRKMQDGARHDNAGKEIK